LEDAALPYESEEMGPQAGEYQRLVDCIECGMCVSACPAAATSTTYMGPAALAAAHQTYVQTGDPSILELVDSQDGVWRCHSAFECTEVCPSHVNPAWRIMSLRRAVMAYRARQFFRFGEKKREGEKP
jgi:succinate dehydrogenase / fumarate reductase iron-sulfur subunit